MNDVEDFLYERMKSSEWLTMEKIKIRSGKAWNNEI